MEKIKLFINDILKIKLAKDLIPFFVMGVVYFSSWVSLSFTRHYFGFSNIDFILGIFLSIIPFLIGKIFLMLFVFWSYFLLVKYSISFLKFLFISKSTKKKGN